MTRELCDAAWALFQETEKAGGLFAALEQNVIQRKVAATRAAREANIAKRRDVLTGASEFPNLHEADIAVLDAKPIALAPYGEAKFKFDPLTPMRLAAPFEALRDRSDAIKKKIRQRGQRCFWPISALPPTSPRARPLPKASSRPAASKPSTPRVLPIPSNLPPRSRRPARSSPAFVPRTRSMPPRAIAAAEALHGAGARHIYLAGRAGEQEAALRSAGVSGFVFAGGDALAALREAWRRMEQA